MSVLDNAWSETSGLVGEDSLPSADQLANGYEHDDDENLDEDRDELMGRGLRRQDTIKSRPGRSSTATSSSTAVEQGQAEFPRG